jgi:hypothetical protein
MLFVIFLALTWSAEVFANTSRDFSSNADGHDETFFVQHRLHEVASVPRGSLDDPIDDFLVDLANNIHQEVGNSGLQDPKKDLAKSPIGKSDLSEAPDEETIDVLDEIRRSLDSIREEISQVTGGSEDGAAVSAATTTVALPPVRSPAGSPSSSPTSTTLISPSNSPESSAGSTVQPPSTTSSLVSNEVDPKVVADNIDMEAEDIKGIFDVLKTYLDKIVHEVREIAPGDAGSVPSGSDHVAEAVPEEPAADYIPERAGEVAVGAPKEPDHEKIQNPNSIKTTTFSPSGEPQPEKRWESLDDLLKGLRDEIGW